MKGQTFFTLALIGGLASASPLAGNNNVVTTTATSTVYTGTASTSIVFQSGNPPTATAAAKRDLQDRDYNASGSTTTVYETITLPASIITSTIYPCATPVSSLTPTLPYGVAQMSNNGSLPDVDGNELYGLSTTQGSTLQGCCNACFFELENCLQSWWYSYEGCVVMSADPSKFNGTGTATATCPQGQISGLEYHKDTNPSFRSDGDFAGPCGQTYLDE